MFLVWASTSRSPERGHAILKYVLQSSSPPVEGYRLRLSSLKKFSFDFLDTSYAIRLLSLFDFPLLEEFVLEDIGKVLSSPEVEDSTSLLLYLASTKGGTSVASMPRSAGSDLPRSGSSSLPLANIHSFELHGIRLVNLDAVRIFLRQLTCSHANFV